MHQNNKYVLQLLNIQINVGKIILESIKMDKNYYVLMGVSEDASDKDIKMAYRKLARKYHPDISKEPNAEERFKEVGEAYEVLRDPIKRAEYDTYRKHGEFNQNAQHTRWPPEGNEPYYTNSFNEDLFETLFGHSRYKPQPMSGQDYHGKINISLEEAFTGTVKNIHVPIEHNAHATKQTLKVKIPPGVKSGQQIRLAGQGASGIHKGPNGDIYLTINVAKHSLFDVLNRDIYLTLPVTPWKLL